MKKQILVGLLALALLPAAARAGSVGVGAFGGMSLPVLQDDNGSGAQFGIRVPVTLLPLLTVEPYFSTGSGGDKDQDVGGISYTRSGIDVTGFGANVLLTFGSSFQFYPYAGIGSYSLERDGLDATETGYTFGLGFKVGLPVEKLALNLRGGMVAVLEEGSSETSRKWGDASVGLSYNLFQFPKP